VTVANLEATFRKDVKRFVIPSVIQMLVANSFSLINVMMVGSLGDSAIAVVAAVGQIGFFLGMILSAIYGISAFITQCYGSGDLVSTKHSFGLMLVSAVVVTVILVSAVYYLRTPILSAFINDPDAVSLGIPYMTVLLAVYVLNAVKDTYGRALSAIGQIRLTLVAGIIAMIINVVLDYALIYGKLGFAEYGITGAAWATLASSLVGGILLIGYVYARKYVFHLTLKEMFSFPYAFAKRVYATTLPLVFHEGLWSFGNMLYAVAFGYMGVAALATFQLARTFNGYFMMGISGFAYAANVMIGQKLGQNKREEALIYARKFTKITIIVSLIFSALIALLSPYIMLLFNQTSSEVQSAFRHVMLIQSVVMAAYFLNNVWIVGLFRAGGDNVYTMKLIFVTTWLIALPLVLTGAYLFHWPLEVVYIMFALEEVSKAGIGYFRYRSSRWANNLVHGIQQTQGGTMQNETKH